MTSLQSSTNSNKITKNSKSTYLQLSFQKNVSVKFVDVQIVVVMYLLIPGTEDGDGDVLMIRHMVGRRIVAEVDSELIGVAAIEDQRRQQAIEEAQLRQATINSMVDNVQAEADNYLAEVEAEAEAEAGRETNGGDGSGDLPTGDRARPGEGPDGAMDQS